MFQGHFKQTLTVGLVLLVAQRDQQPGLVGRSSLLSRSLGQDKRGGEFPFQAVFCIYGLLAVRRGRVDSPCLWRRWLLFCYPPRVPSAGAGSMQQYISTRVSRVPANGATWSSCSAWIFPVPWEIGNVRLALTSPLLCHSKIQP